MKIKKGFTLIELLIVLAIIAIVTAITIPSVAGYNKSRQKKNCQAEMQMLYEEIENSLSSQRFSSTDEVDKEIIRTVLNHVQGVNIKDSAGNLISLESYGSLKGSDGTVSMTVNGICTNNGTYDMKWVTTGTSKFTVTGEIKCSHDKDVSQAINIECSKHVTKLSNSHFKRNVSKEAIQIYDKVQKYINDNVSSTNIKQFMKDTPGCIGGSPDTTKFKLPEGFTNYSADTTRENANKSAIFNASNLGVKLYGTDTIIALTVNPDTKVLEYLAVALSYDNTGYTNEDGSDGGVETYCISMFNDGGSIAYFNGDMGKYYPCINTDEDVYAEKNVSVQGNRGSYAANILWSATTEWKDFFDTEEETGTARAATEETTTVIEDNSPKITGPVTRIGDYPSSGFKWNYYNKNWYYEDQTWIKTLKSGESYPRNNDVNLKNNISGGINYTENVNLSDFSNYHDLKDLVLDSSYNAVDGATVTYNTDSAVNTVSKVYHNTADMFKNKLNGYTNMNGFFYLNTIQTLYNPFDNQMLDENEQKYISDYNSAKTTEIYLAYNENNVTDQLRLVRTKNYEKCDFKIVDNGQEISPGNTVGISYSRNKFKITAYYTANIDSNPSKPVRIKGDISLDSCADKLVIYDAKDTNQRYEGIDAENKLYSGGRYYVYIGLDKEDGTTTAPANKDGVDSSHLYYFEPSGVPDILYSTHTDSKGKNVATVLSIKQLDPVNNNTEKKADKESYVYYDTNVINIPSQFKGYWEKVDRSYYSGASEEEKRNIRCFFVDPGDYNGSSNEYSRGAKYYKYVEDDVHYEVTQIGDGATDEKALDNDVSDLRANVVYVPSISIVKDLDFDKGTTRKGAMVDGWTICIPSTVQYIATGAFCERDYTSTNDFAIKGDGSLDTIGIFDNSTKRYIKKIKFEEGSQCGYIGAYAFYGDFNLLEVENMPADVGNNIGQYAFGYCFNLKEINLPGNLTKIRKGTFLSCSALNTEKQWTSFLPQNIESIGDYAFKDCYSMVGLLDLTKYKELLSIGKYAFYNCHNILAVDIPKNVTSIGDYAFACITTTPEDENANIFRYSKYIEDIDPYYAIRQDSPDYRGNYNQRKTDEVKINYLAYDAIAKYTDNMFECTNYDIVYLPSSSNNSNKLTFMGMTDKTIVIRDYYNRIGISGDFKDNSLIIEKIGDGITDLDNHSTSFQLNGLFKANSTNIRGNLFIQNVDNRIYGSVFKSSQALLASNNIAGYMNNIDYRGGSDSKNEKISVRPSKEKTIKTEFASGNLIFKNVNCMQTVLQGISIDDLIKQGGTFNPAFSLELIDELNVIRAYGFKSIWLDNVKYIDNYSFDGCLFADYAIITHIDDDAVAYVNTDLEDDFNRRKNNNDNGLVKSEIPFLERDETGKITKINGIKNAAFAARPIYLDECEDEYTNTSIVQKIKNNEKFTGSINGKDYNTYLGKYVRYTMGDKTYYIPNCQGVIRGSLAGYFDGTASGNEDVINREVSFDINKISSKKSKEFELYLPNELYIFAKIYQSEYCQKNTTNIFGADSIHPINTIGNIRESEYYALYQKEIEQCLKVNPDLFNDSSFAQDHPTEYGTITKDKTGKLTIKPFDMKGYNYGLDIDLVK